MSLVLCQECGEETLDQLANCPHCDEPIPANRDIENRHNVRQLFFGVAFIGGLGAATLCNMIGRTGWAMGLGLASLSFMAILLLSLKNDS